MIIIGFIAGLIARVLSPGPNEPKGFILTTVLGIAGAFVATFIGQSIGWYRLDQGAGLIAATVGALVVLFIWNRLVVHRIVRPGQPQRAITSQLAVGHWPNPKARHQTSTQGGRHGTGGYSHWHDEWPARPAPTQQRRWRYVADHVGAAGAPRL